MPSTPTTGITRTCGGDPNATDSEVSELMYYPHMRGWSRLTRSNWIKYEVLPAHAGVILRYCSNSLSLVGITRTCGGDPHNYAKAYNLTLYYPHMRGWSRLKQLKHCLHRVLPAHAGVILNSVPCFLLNHGITRTCGGDPSGNLPR